MKIADAPLARSALTVRPYRSQDAERWDAFVEQCPEATFYHRVGWRELMERVFRHRTHYLLAERGDRIVGVLPLAEVRSLLFGHALVSMPFAAHAGAAVEEPDARQLLHAEAVRIARDLGVDYLELRGLQRYEPDWPLQDLYVTFRKQIHPEDEANLAAIPRKQRAMVRKAIGRGLVAETDDRVDRFFELYADNVHRHGTPPLPARYFEELMRVFRGNCDVLTVLNPQGRPVSSVLSFYFRGEVLPVYAGDVTEARELAANDYKYWELMRRSAARGCRMFNYGRSKRGSGQFDFKKNWGFEPTPLYYEYSLFKREQVPQNNPNNAKYRALIAMWRRLPRAVVNRLGPVIVRNLG